MCPTTVDALSAATDRPDAPVRGLAAGPAHASRLAARLGRAKLAYTTRQVPAEALQRLIELDPDGDAGPRPRAGDLLLARVEQLGHHRRIELANGRRASLFEDDEIVVCYGNRYAPDQFEGEVPLDLGVALRASLRGSSHGCRELPPAGGPARRQPARGARRDGGRRRAVGRGRARRDALVLGGSRPRRGAGRGSLGRPVRS